MPDIEPIKARVVIEYDGSGLEKAKEDLQSLGEASGAVGESVGGAGESLATLDEQMGKNAGSAKSFNEALMGLPKVFEGGEVSVSNFNDVLAGQRGIIEDTATSLTAMQEPLKSFNESMQTVSETVGSPHFAENMSVFHDALVNPEPYQLVQGYLGETGQSWSDFATSIGSDNMSILKSNREFLSDLRSSGGSVFEMYGGEAVKAVTTDLGAFASQMDGVAESVTRTNEGINKFGGIEGVLTGPLEELQSYKPLGFGEAFSNASEGMMGMLNNIAMPLMAVQMIGMVVQQVGQGIYDMAAVAEGPSAHGVGTFTGTIDALGQSMQKTAAQFSEGIGQGMLPALNALNYQMAQSDTGGTGINLGKGAGLLFDVAQIGLGINPGGGAEGIINMFANELGMQQPFQGPPPQAQGLIAHQQAFANMPKTIQDMGYQLQTQTDMYLQMASSPNLLADQEQFAAAQQIYQRAQQSYDISHPINRQQMLMEYQYQQYAQQQEANYAAAQANAPTYFGDMMSNLFQGNFGAAGQDFMQSGAANLSLPYLLYRGFSSAGGSGGFMGGLGDFLNGPAGTLLFGSLGPMQALTHIGDMFGGIGDFFSNLFGGGGTSGAGYSGGCFVAGTRVLMADGSEKPIEQVQVGDCVLAHNGLDDVVTTMLARIVPPPKMVYTLTFSDGNTLTLTDSHPIATPLQGWKALSVEHAKQENPNLPVSTLEIGDGVCTIYGTCTLVSVQPREVTQVYNITVDEPHTFYANKVLVHNKTTGAQISEQVSGIQLPTIDLSGIASQLASAFGGIQVPHLDLSGLTAGLTSAFSGISLPALPDIGGMLNGALSGMFGSISLPAIPDIGSMLSGALSGMFGGISIPTPPDIGGMLSGAMSGIFGGIALPTVPDLGGMLSGAMSGMFGGISLPAIPNLGAMINGALSGMFGGISIPGFAGGVENFAGGAAFIAEGGPELVTLPQGASVYPLSTGAAVGGNMTPISLGGGGGSAPQSMNVYLNIDGQTFWSAAGISLAQNTRASSGMRSY